MPLVTSNAAHRGGDTVTEIVDVSGVSAAVHAAEAALESVVDPSESVTSSRLAQPRAVQGNCAAL